MGAESWRGRNATKGGCLAVGPEAGACSGAGGRVFRAGPLARGVRILARVRCRVQASSEA